MNEYRSRAPSAAAGGPFRGGEGGGQGVRDPNSEPGQGRSHKEACVCPMIGHGVGGECVVDGQIAGWYKGNEGGEELARCGGAVGWGWHGGAAP